MYQKLRELAKFNPQLNRIKTDKGKKGTNHTVFEATCKIPYRNYRKYEEI